MYQRRYYEVKWKAICGKKWKEYQAALGEGEEAKARITFTNELCLRYLEAEPDEIQKEIDSLMERQAKGERFLLEDKELAEDEDGEGGEEAVDERRKAVATTLTSWNKLVLRIPFRDKAERLPCIVATSRSSLNLSRSFSGRSARKRASLRLSSWVGLIPETTERLFPCCMSINLLYHPCKLTAR